MTLYSFSRVKMLINTGLTELNLKLHNILYCNLTFSRGKVKQVKDSICDGLEVGMSYNIGGPILA